MATSLWLPDFVAYPFCYLGLRAALPETAAAAIHVDYNDHWPYRSVDELAASIVRTLDGAAVDAVIGYSFGAYVAVEVAGALGGEGRAVELLLIDPLPPTAISSLAAEDIEAILRGRPEYGYVFELVDCDLTSLECMVTNVQALGRLAEPVPVGGRGTLLVAGGRAKAEEVLRCFDCPAGRLDVICLVDCDHRSIVSHPLLRDLVAAKLRRCA